MSIKLCSRQEVIGRVADRKQMCDRRGLNEDQDGAIQQVVLPALKEFVLVKSIQEEHKKVSLPIHFHTTAMTVIHVSKWENCTSL